MITQEDKRLLADLIVEYIKKDFAYIHFSGNLSATIQIEEDASGLRVIVPAEKFDIGMYKAKGEIVYTHNGSYADSVDREGGWSGRHKNYIEKSIKAAIYRWLLERKIEGKVRL